MKEVRFNGDLGAGASSSKVTFCSDLFLVKVWKHQNGKRKTELICTVLPDGLSQIYFKGELDVSSDADCIKLYSPEEVVLMINGQITHSIEKGRIEKAREISKALLI